MTTLDYQFWLVIAICIIAFCLVIIFVERISPLESQQQENSGLQKCALIEEWRSQSRLFGINQRDFCGENGEMIEVNCQEYNFKSQYDYCLTCKDKDD